MAVTRLHHEEPRIPVGLLGSSGLRIPRLVLGTGAWSGLERQDAQELIRTMLDAGGFALEVSDIDGGHIEAAVGGLLGADLERPDTVLIGRSGRGPGGTALPGVIGDSSRRGLVRSLDDTLVRLDVEHLDLWLVDGLDGVTPMHEVAATMEWAVTSGRASHVGIARVPAWMAVDLAHHLRARGLTLAAHTVPYNLLHRDAEHDVIPAAKGLKHGVLAAMPLAGGILTGKYRHGTQADSRLASGRSPLPQHHLGARSRAIVESLATAADGLGVHPTELALAWALQRPGIDGILVGSRSAAQLRGSLRATTLTLPGEIIDVLDEVSASPR